MVVIAPVSSPFFVTTKCGARTNDSVPMLAQYIVARVLWITIANFGHRAIALLEVVGACPCQQCTISRFMYNLSIHSTCNGQRIDQLNGNGPNCKVYRSRPIAGETRLKILALRRILAIIINRYTCMSQSLGIDFRMGILSKIKSDERYSKQSNAILFRFQVQSKTQLTCSPIKKF